MNRFSFGVAIALAVLGFVWSATAAAATDGDDAPRVKIGWTKQPPELDGRLTPGEWSDAAHIDGLTQATPSPGDAPSQRTEIWIMTDGESLFIGARLWDTNPEEIVALRMLRDGDTLRDDRFGFTIDPFLDRQNGYFFQVNSNGVRRDFLIEGTTIETSWDARWFVKTSVDAEGWTAEIAVPFSSINFDANADVWGLNMARGIRRNDEIDRWSDPVLERFLTSMGRAGYLEGMSGIKQGLGIQVVPNATLSRVENEVDNTGDTEFEPSLDVFYKVTPALTTALTVNTDFSEVEADERQVNLTRFGLFFPEKRDFFLQDALIFNFGEIEQNGRPFFSRRIGLGGNGEIRDIVAGAKVTGRAGPVKIGIVDVVVDERARVDQANLLVARLATSVFGESTVGAIVTHGNPEANGDNTVIGGDFVYRNNRFLDNKSINAAVWVQGSFSDPDSILVPDPNAGDIVDGNGLAYGGRINYPNDRIRWNLGFSEFQDEFNPALGFVNRVGIREYDGEFRFRTRPTGGLFRTVDTTMSGRIVTSSNATNTLRSSEFNFFPIILTTPILDSIEFRYVHSYEFTSRTFSSLQIGPGEYHFDEGRIKIATSGNRRISGELEVAHGTFFDGTRTRVTSDIEIRPVKYLLLGGQYEFNDIRLPGSDLLSTANDQDRDAQIHVVRGRLNLFFTPEISLLTLVQFDNVSDSLGFNSRLRWILQEGREIFIVVNQGADTQDGVRATRTELIAKLQWTFTF